MNDKPIVTVISLGGTIASTASTESGLAGPRLTASDLISAVPEVELLAEVEVIDLAQLPSCDLGFELAIALAEAVNAAAARGSSGVVVTQGTDTIEEMSYCLDILVTSDVPVAVVGAMRHSGLSGADGLANLLDAARTVVNPGARGLGCLVVVNSEIHSARTVRKLHTSSPSAFRSDIVGPIGWISEGVPHLRDRPFARTVLELPPDTNIVRPPLVRITMDDDGWWLPAVAEGRTGGLVIEGTGGGHLPSRLADEIVAVAQRIPVVLTSRAGAGDVLRSTYGGFKGSETYLIEGGLIPGGSLDGIKARILLALLLMADVDRAAIDHEIATAGRLCRHGG